MKTTRKSSLSIKIALYFIISFVGVMMTATLIGFLVLRGRYDSLDNREFMILVYVGISLLGLLILMIFAIFMNKLVVVRLKKLNSALDEVAKGNYDMYVDVKGNDELSSLTRNFNRMSRELRANELLSKDFARYVSHEYKTPLSIIRGYSEYLETILDMEEGRKAAAVIIRETDRLSDLSKSILEISKLDSITIINRDESLNPAVQIRTILQNTHLVWSRKKIDMKLELEDFMIKSNESMLFQVWQNLISNALKFSNEGGEIEIFLAKIDNVVTFQIRDHGIGIPENDIDRVFQQFFVGDQSRNKEGSGLGLTLVRKIVEKLEGRIYLSSVEGVGTTFVVELPVLNEA